MVAACTPPSKSYEEWSGRWIGPEGTYLELTPQDDHYQVAIRDLDSVTHYIGEAGGNGITFTRNGQSETIHAGTGPDTGMKWLMDKKNCLVVRTGEGYCR